VHIKEVELFGFRRFTHLKITGLPQAAKLVILAGPNGNGKSSLFDAFISYHHRFSGLGANWHADYHEKISDLSKRDWTSRIRIEFHEPVPEDVIGRKKMFYVRSAYRNDPDFTARELQRVPSSFEQRRLERLIDNEAAVSINYRRIASLAIAELYGTDNEKRTFGDFRSETRGAINDQLNRLFANVSLTNLGRPLEDGTFERRQQGLPVQKSIRRRKGRL